MKARVGRLSLSRLTAMGAVAALIAVALAPGGASAAVTPTISGSSTSPGWAGLPIRDSANLSGGLNLTGSITFRLYGIGDTTCSAPPIFTNTKPVAGEGHYTSDAWVTNAAGSYRWIAAYNGDANNNPVATPCGHINQIVSVAKANPVFTGAASLVSPAFTITNTANLDKGVGPTGGPTGTITFALYGPDTCSTGPVFTSVKTVNGNGNYTSDEYRPPAAGRYIWKLTYSGDANNIAAYTACSDPNNDVTVGTPPPAAFAVTGSPSAVAAGGQVTATWTGLAGSTSNDWVGLYRIGAPGWALTAWTYTTGAASGSVILAVPPGTAPGTYELRLRTAKSGPITVS